MINGYSSPSPPFAHPATPPQSTRRNSARPHVCSKRFSFKSIAGDSFFAAKIMLYFEIDQEVDYLERKILVNRKVIYH
jgi:hypothetical protein